MSISTSSLSKKSADFPSGRNVLIAGGAGFLGSHLCSLLAATDHTVYCLDNLSTGRRSNIRELEEAGKAKFIKGDVENELPDGLPEFDEIYNLACPASPIHYQRDPIKTALTSAVGTLNLLSRSEACGARFFQASTSEIYGDPDVHPQTESYHGNVNPYGPRSCYDEGKRFAETLCRDFAETRGVTVRIARIFNTYGPGMDPVDGRVVSNFIVQALQDEDITIYGDGSQTRSFCYVDDLIAGFYALMKSDKQIDGPVNLGNPIELMVGELAHLVIELVGSRSKIVTRPLPTDDPRRRRPDIRQAERYLDWAPKVALRDGLRATIEYFDRELTQASGQTSKLAAYA